MTSEQRMNEFHVRFGFPQVPLKEIKRDIIVDQRLRTIAIELAERAESILPEAIDRHRFNDPRLYRIHLLLEELSEYASALADRDMIHAADAIGDLGYVVEGSAWTDGVPYDELIAEIHRSNMTKQRSVGNERMRDKGPDYSPPDIAGVLAEHTLSSVFGKSGDGDTLPEELGPCGHPASAYETEGDCPAGNWRTYCPMCRAAKANRM